MNKFLKGLIFKIKKFGKRKEKGKEKETDVSVTKTNSSTNILIVDDSQINRLVLKKYINKCDPEIEVYEAENGQIAVDLVKQNNYDIIFMDFRMPILDGFQATTIIKQIQPASIIIGVTGQIEKPSVERALKVGMIRCLSKPIDFREFKQFLELLTTKQSKKLSDPLING